MSSAATTPKLLSPAPTSEHLHKPSMLDSSSSRTSVTVNPQENEEEDVNTQFEHEAYGPAPGEKPDDPFEVTMGPQDPDNPKTWSRVYRWYITMASALLLLNAYVPSSFVEAPCVV